MDSRQPPEGADADAAWAPPPAAAPAPAAVDLLPGYDRVEPIARGGDSVVYRARQVAVGRAVAIKVLDLGASGLDDRARERFARELEVTVRLGRQHPHIVTVLDTGTTPQGDPAIVMELYDLGSLHDRLAAVGPLPVADVVAAGTVVADALAFAHRQGVLHRDVKPQNVLLLPTSYVLADFGIARQAGSERTASVERFSYRHASPQVLDGNPPTAADDVWSLGSTLFTLLDGRPPFASDDPEQDSALQYLRRVRTGERRALRRDDVPADLLAVVGRCLEGDPVARWGSAQEVHDALSAVAAGLRAYLPGSPSAGPAPAVAPEPVPEPEPGQEPEPNQEPEPPALPEPPGHVVVSPSALTHAGAPRTSGGAVPHPDEGPDPDATGVAPREPAATPAQPAPSAAPDAAPGSRRRRLVLAGIAAALLVGVAVGFLVTQAARRDGAQAPTAPTTTATSVPVIPSSEPVPTATAPDFSDPQMDPEASFVDEGAAVSVTWTDPTEGEALFLVLLKGPTGEWAPVAQLDPGSQDYLFTDFDPAAQDLCMTVTAILVSDPEVNGATPEFPVRGTCPPDPQD